MSTRQTIGFLTSNIHTGASQTMWPGLLDAAADYDVNLLCFPGGGLGVQPGFEAQRNAVYNLVSSERVNALVSWASTLGVALEKDEIRKFHDRFHPLPMVSMALPLDEIPTISVNSYDGMCDAIVHLIKTHGLRKIAFIRGPESHPYAQERFRAYQDVLQTYSIPFDPTLVTPPMDWEAGVQAIQLLLDERHLRAGVDFEAVAAVSDLLALAAMKTLQAHGFKVPEDVAVMGFNDFNEGRYSSPPLSSVYLSFHEQGYRALETALKLLAGEVVPENVFLPTRLIIRQSCGCPSQSILQAAAGHPPQQDADTQPFLSALSKRSIAEITDSSEHPGQSLLLVEALYASLESGSEKKFLSALEGILQQEARSNGDIMEWQNQVSDLRKKILPRVGLEIRCRCEDIFNQARVLICDVALRNQAFQQINSNRQSDKLREISQLLITTFDIHGLVEVLAERLPGLGIPSCYLALYENNQPASEYSRMVMAYTDQVRFPVEEDGERFLTHHLVPRGYLPARRFSMVVEPLYFREEQIGLILFEIGPREGSLYEVLRAQIGSAIKGAFLFQQAQQARLTAEKADRIKTRLLAYVSHELRTPLNIILSRTKDALALPDPNEVEPSPALVQDLQHIQTSAEHQLRVINDLLDLSRAEINELDLYPELVDPRPLLEDIFNSSSLQPLNKMVTWELDLPERLPIIKADPVRLRQILLNLLSNAARFTERGTITLGAEITLPYLHLWIRDTGIGISPEDKERIFEPFVTAEHDGGIHGGIGLGLSITRRLVILHGGNMALESQVGNGSIFHVYFPLLNFGEKSTSLENSNYPTLLFISGSNIPPVEINELCSRQGLTLYHARPVDDFDQILAAVHPVCLAWDLFSTSASDWQAVRRYYHHPALAGIPFILYSGNQAGLTEVLVKPASSQLLMDAIAAIYPSQPKSVVLIVDDDPGTLVSLQQVVSKGLGDPVIKSAANGKTAIDIMRNEIPNLVILDLMMPELDGFGVLEHMRTDPHLFQVPVIILSNKQLDSEDIKRLEKYSRVVLHTKGILSEEELVTAFHRNLFGSEELPAQTGMLVKQALAYIHQNYTRPIARWEIAKGVGVSEDYLSRVFLLEMNISLWDYINRYRIYHAQQLLRYSADSVQSIARQVGFKDQAYFCRVFHNLTGVSPTAYRSTPQA